MRITTQKPAEILQSAVQSWAADYPRTTERLNSLISKGVRCGIFSSALSGMIAAQTGVPLPRMPDDLDLLVHNEDFMLAAALLPESHVETNLPVVIHASDGQRLWLRAHEAKAQGAQELPIQFMQPLTPLQRSKYGHNTQFTDEAFAHTTVVATEYGSVPVAPIIRSLAMYAILQRDGLGKCDAVNAAIIHAAYDPEDQYASYCAAEMNLQQREQDYLAVIGRQVMRPLVAVA